MTTIMHYLTMGFTMLNASNSTIHLYSEKPESSSSILALLTKADITGRDSSWLFNLPFDFRVKSGSKYYKTWVMVNGWMRPSKNARMSPRLFLNKIFKIKTRVVKPKHHDKLMPETFWYSVVDEIIQVIAG